MKKLRIDESYWSFNRCINFIVIPQIVTDYTVGSKINLETKSLFGTISKTALVDSVTHCKIDEIENIQYWHLFRLLKLSDFVEPVSDIYHYEDQTALLNKCLHYILCYNKPRFNKNEIVTVIYFTFKNEYIGYDSGNIHEMYNVYMKLLYDVIKKEPKHGWKIT